MNIPIHILRGQYNLMMEFFKAQKKAQDEQDAKDKSKMGSGSTPRIPSIPRVASPRIPR